MHCTYTARRVWIVHNLGSIRWKGWGRWKDPLRTEAKQNYNEGTLLLHKLTLAHCIHLNYEYMCCIYEIMLDHINIFLTYLWPIWLFHILQSINTLRYGSHLQTFSNTLAFTHSRFHVVKPSNYPYFFRSSVFFWGFGLQIFRFVQILTFSALRICAISPQTFISSDVRIFRNSAFSFLSFWRAYQAP